MNVATALLHLALLLAQAIKPTSFMMLSGMRHFQDLTEGV